MTVMNGKEASPYRLLEEQFAGKPDEFWEYLEEHKHDHRSICVGWAVKSAERFLQLDQVGIAARTEVRNERGELVEKAYSKSYISAILSERSSASPEAYLRIAKACQVNVLEFHIAEGWVPPEYIAAYRMVESELALPILKELAKLPAEAQPSARAVVISVLQSIAATTGASSNGTSKTKSRKK